MPTKTAERNALHTIEQAEQDNEQRKTLWRLLAAYHMTNSYEEWLVQIRTKPSPEAEQLYDHITDVYLVMWRERGWEALRTAINVGWHGGRT